MRLIDATPEVCEPYLYDHLDDLHMIAAQNAIDDMPTVDAEPVVHGKWDDESVAFYRKCSECGCCVEWDKKPFLYGIGEYNYCPNCGAKMDGGADDEAL